LGCDPGYRGDAAGHGKRRQQLPQRKEAGPTSAEKARIKELEREVRERRQANEILKKASVYFAQAELDRPFRN
jgi:transposase-like protein